MISCLGWFYSEADDLAAKRLTLEAPPNIEDRVSLLVCPECGDEMCGAVTARVSAEGDEIVWRDLAKSFPDYSGEYIGWTHEPLSGFAEEARFDADAYRRVVESRPAPMTHEA